MTFRNTFLKLALRHRHNDYDYDCIYWWGDRNPEPDDKINRNLDDTPAPMHARRCLVCRPYAENEAQDMLGWGDKNWAAPLTSEI